MLIDETRTTDGAQEPERVEPLYISPTRPRLHAAVVHGHFAEVRRIVTARPSSIDSLDDFGYAPIHYAAKRCPLLWV